MPWQPIDKYIWDFWLVEKDDCQHLFYLQADKEQCRFNPDNRHDLASVGHAVSSSLGWKEIDSERPAFEASKNWDDTSIWTGSIIYDSSCPYKSYLLFYTSRTSHDPLIWTPLEYQRPQHIGIAQSTDLYCWKRLSEYEERPAIANPGSGTIFDGVAWRDPFVLPYKNGYLCLICARIASGAVPGIGSIDDGGAIAAIRSDNLRDWSNSAPQLLVASDHFYQMEVPQLLPVVLGDRLYYYLVFCAREADCSRKRKNSMPADQCKTGTYYMRSQPLSSDDELLPRFEEPARLLAENLYAGRIFSFMSDPILKDKLFFMGFHWNEKLSDAYSLQGLSDPALIEIKQCGAMSICDDYATELLS